MTENTAPLSVNVANINKMIEAISRQHQPIRMGSFLDRNAECGTTACLAGWANVLRHDVQGKGMRSGDYVQVGDDEFDIGNAYRAAEWMGIDYPLSNHLFYEFSADDLPHDQRKAATIELLTTLRDTGTANWHDVLRKYL